MGVLCGTEEDVSDLVAVDSISVISLGDAHALRENEIRKIKKNAKRAWFNIVTSILDLYTNITATIQPYCYPSNCSLDRHKLKFAMH
jgi:hypothetical protein